jgi:hypothetical protein
MVWSWWRLAAAVTALSGVAAGYVVNLDRAERMGQDLGLVLANYFSLFTIVTAILAVVALSGAAVWSQRHRGVSAEPFVLALGLALVTGPTLLLGVFYNAMLRGQPSEVALADSPGIHLMDSFAAEVLHVVLPLYLLIDLLFATRRRALPWWTLAVLTAYPVIWILYTMLRGALVTDPAGSPAWWYPYGFLDPHGSGGWPSVMIYIGVLLVAQILLGSAVIAVSRSRGRRRSSAGHPRG